ncbi:alpha/beta hydrolase [Rhodococcus sp. NPDC059234]|uniref:alpha/beta hydrolase n=1 Tax=Rhodococcus sp. NPDC059234 TaxID=3346781 RepID=UPI00366DC2F0
MAVAVEPQFIPGASLRSQLLAGALRHTVKPVLGVWGCWPSPLWPAGLLDYAARFLPPTRGARSQRVRLDECDAEWTPAAGGGERAVLYLHGGGFLTCGLNTHRRLAARVGDAVGAGVLSVDYRMLPRYPIGDAVADGVAGYRWLLDRGYDPNRIVVAGDSAGGYLTFMTALAAAELGLPSPAALVALSPLTDLNPAGKLANPGADDCPLIPRSVIVALAEITERVNRRAPREVGGRTRSPVDSVLTGLPPVLIQVGSTEMLYPDAELMAQRLGAAGVPVTLEVWDRQVHVFHAAADLVPEAGRAIARIGEFVRAATGDAVVSESGPKAALTPAEA